MAENIRLQIGKRRFLLMTAIQKQAWSVLTNTEFLIMVPI